MLLEREPQLTRLRRAVAAAAAGTGSVVLIEGPAGIGKTALLLAGRQLAEQGGLRFLRARCSELEQEFAFGVVRQLLETVLARADETERAALLSGAAALASPLFDLPAPGRRAGRRRPGSLGGDARRRGPPRVRPHVHARARPVLADREPC